MKDRPAFLDARTSSRRDFSKKNWEAPDHPRPWKKEIVAARRIQAAARDRGHNSQVPLVANQFDDRVSPHECIHDIHALVGRTIVFDNHFRRPVPLIKDGMRSQCREGRNSGMVVQVGMMTDSFPRGTMTFSLVATISNPKVLPQMLRRAPACIFSIRQWNQCNNPPCSLHPRKRALPIGGAHVRQPRSGSTAAFAAARRRSATHRQ